MTLRSDAELDVRKCSDADSTASAEPDKDLCRAAEGMSRSSPSRFFVNAVSDGAVLAGVDGSSCASFSNLLRKALTGIELSTSFPDELSSDIVVDH